MPADRLVWSPSTALCQPLKWSCLWAVDFLWSWFVEEKLDYLTGNLILKPCLVLQTFKMQNALWVLLLQDLVGFFFPPIANSRFVCAAPLSALWAKCVPLYLWQKTTLTECNILGTFYFSISTYSLFWFSAIKVIWMLNTRVSHFTLFLNWA